MTFNQDYYGILGIDSHASPQAVVHVYKNLQKAYHPDLHPENRAFYTEKIQIINEAFEILGNPKARAEYDRSLAGDFSDADDNTSFSDDQQSGCQKCGKQKEDFEIACSNCGSWFTSTMSEKSSFHDNLRTVVQYDTIKTMGFNIAKTAIGATTSGFVAIENGVRLAKESASMIGEQVSRIMHGRSHSDLWS